jgi:predicted glycoside hydrolase/deacetylase ChbG (UPF0249 family)
MQSKEEQNRRYPIVAADDFGRSSSVNLAVATAHDRGIVTASSIMAAGTGFIFSVLSLSDTESLPVSKRLSILHGRGYEAIF